MSILPLKYVVEQITGQDFEVNVLVPPGASPETYEPTMQQLTVVSDSKLLFTTGLLDFEKGITSKIAANSDTKIVDLSEGIDLIEGDCSHQSDGHNHHNHGVDPHIWSSPRELIKMAETAYNALALLYPDSVKYNENLKDFRLRLKELDQQISIIVSNTNIKYFIIYHPALSYYSRSYGLAQVSLEHEGKEPTVRHIRQIVDMAKADGIDKILVQRQFSKTTIESIAKDIGAEIYEIDPLAENVIENLLHITELITK